MDQGKPDTETMSLTSREKEILDLVVNHGKLNKEIAAELLLSEQTVKNYLRGALRHFGARRTRELFPIIERVRSEIQHSTLPLNEEAISTV
jgi:DNA-binding NarL/FixJ family response regulator